MPRFFLSPLHASSFLPHTTPYLLSTYFRNEHACNQSILRPLLHYALRVSISRVSSSTPPYVVLCSISFSCTLPHFLCILTHTHIYSDVVLVCLFVLMDGWMEDVNLLLLLWIVFGSLCFPSLLTHVALPPPSPVCFAYLQPRFFGFGFDVCWVWFCES